MERPKVKIVYYNSLTNFERELLNKITELNKYIDFLENSKKAEKVFNPPKINEVIDFFISKGFPESHAIKVFDYYNDANWKDSNGKQVKNWKQKMSANWMDEKFKTQIRIGDQKIGVIQAAASLYDKYKMTSESLYDKYKNDLI